MQIILASAKIMNTATNVQLPNTTQPRFGTEANKFALELNERSVEELQEQLKCSKSLAQETKQRYADFFNEQAKIPAILAYYGQAYKCLKAENFKLKDYLFAAEKLWILSFLYGVLRPTDRIHPYRLEGKMKLNCNDEQNMFEYWKPILTDVLINSVKADDGILVHLATEEYQHLFDWKRILKEVHVVQPLFKVKAGDKLKNVTVYAKSCRGAMTRFIIENKLKKTKELLNFEYEGFQFANHDLSSLNQSTGLTELLWTL